MDLPGVKDGIRVGLCILLFESLGLFIGKESLVGRTFTGDCTWAAITIAVISNPLVGNVSQKGFQRICGSITGGFLAAGLLYTGYTGLLVAGSFLIAVFGSWAGSYFKADYGGKILVVTFLIVLQYLGEPPGTVLIDYALGRIISVTVAVAVGIVMAVLVFPSSATDLVFKELRKAVQGCHDLHLASIEVIGTGWMYATEGTVQEQLQRQQQQQQQEDAQQGDEGKGLVCKGTELQKEMETGLAGKGGPTGLGPFPAPLLPPPSTAKSASQRCEDAQLMVVKAARAVEDNLVVAENEAFTGAVLGHMIVLPQFPTLAGMASSIRSFWGDVKEGCTEAAAWMRGSVPKADSRSPPAALSRHGSSLATMSSPPVYGMSFSIRTRSGDESNPATQLGPIQERPSRATLCMRSTTYPSASAATSDPEWIRDTISDADPSLQGSNAAHRSSEVVVTLQGGPKGPSEAVVDDAGSSGRAERRRTGCHACAIGLPAEEVKRVLSSVRHLTRVVWAGHIALAEGFEAEVVELLKFRYPSGMLSELGGAMGAFLEDVIASLPQDGHKAAQWKVTELPSENLERYETALAKMQEASFQFQKVLKTRAMGNGAIESSLPIEEKSLGLAGDGKGTAPPSSQDASFAQTALTEARPSDDVNNPTQLVMLRPTIEHNQARLRWHATQYALQQMYSEAVKLRAAVNVLLIKLQNR